MSVSKNEPSADRIPPGQQLVAPGKWPVIGEKKPAHENEPWSLTVKGLVGETMSWTLSELRELPQTELQLDIHCVTRWSKLDNTFSGVTLAHILKLVQPLPSAKYISFVSRSSQNHSTSLLIDDALEQQTLIALDYDNGPLDIGHGGPIRNIVPGRYFYKSVKWLEQIELLEHDRLGMWEAESGYHNQADPWEEQRYMSPTIDKRKAAALIRSKDFSGEDLRSIDASDRDLGSLKATAALIRDARFNRANLREASFENANLSNSHFRDADLRNASFRHADVEGADFSGADLRGADFTGASLIGASFVDTTGERKEATIDQTTILPDEAIEPLFPEQLAFVRSMR